MENSNSSMTNKSSSVELTQLSNLMKISAVSSTSSSSSLLLQSPTSSPLITIGNLNKINKYSSNINQQDSSLLNFVLRSDTNQDFNEKKLIIVSLTIQFSIIKILFFYRNIL
jgi:hypothetical protein